MLFPTLLFTCLCLNFLCVSAKSSCSKVTNGVQCGFPGITKHKCLQDCKCCYDAGAKDENVKCIFKEAPGKTYCNIKPGKRVACEVDDDQDLPDDFDLNTEPYLCRRIGCCFDSSDDDDVPSCYQAKPKSCKQVAHLHRVDASSGSDVTEKQCLRQPGTCFERFAEPKCYYKYAPCKCAVTNGHKVKRCLHNGKLIKSPYRCLFAGCCYDWKHKCYKPVARESYGASAQSEEEEDYESTVETAESQSSNDEDVETDDTHKETDQDKPDLEQQAVAEQEPPSEDAAQPPQ